MELRQATIGGIECLAMMEEKTEQVERQDGSVDQVYTWEGKCRVPAPRNTRFVNAALELESVMYRGPLRRESGQIEEVEGEVVVRFSPGSGGMARTGETEHSLAANTTQDVFELTGSGKPVSTDGP